MKKLFLGLFIFVAASTVTLAQEDPEKALTKAGRALGSYNLDPSNNGDKLKEAIEMIDIAAAADINKGKVKTWQTKGEIYNALADKDVSAMVLNADHKPEKPEAPIVAAEAFIKAAELAQKKYETKDAIKGMTESAGKLSNFGNGQIKRQEYAAAFKSLSAVLAIDEAVRKNAGEPVIADADMSNHKFVLAYCASASGDKANAKKYFKELYEGGTAEAGVYAQYFTLLSDEGNEAEALVVLEKGRSKFPSDSEILFATINHYIKKQNFKELEKLLEEAIQKEPNNPTIYTALGNVYMNLFTEAYAKDRKSATATQYFDKALQYFDKAISLDPKQFDAIYSIGSLYFNKSVEVIKVAGDLPMDKKSQELYKEMMLEAKGLMEKALPYFQKTEGMNPSDQNTLIALSEIYARIDDLEKSKIFKDRLETVKAGGKVESSYFKN